MSTFLLEIGTEELPADFAQLVIPQLEQAVSRDLKEQRLNHGLIFVSTTPRRISLVVEDLASYALDLEEECKGPPADIAFKDGEPLDAALGFARRLKVDCNQLIVKETPKGKFIFGKTIQKGESSSILLTKLIPEWISGLQGRRFMRWGNDDYRFSRPIRWIVSLLDEELIPISMQSTDPKVNSSRISKGHRLKKDDVYIDSAKQYKSVLKDAGVVVDRKVRFEMIKGLVDVSSSQLEAIPDLPFDLLQELTDLVESPSLIEGSIDSIFLELPPEVLSTVMKVHQRYIPLYLKSADKDPLILNSKSTLLPTFLCVCNSLEDSNDIVRLGNERVLRARLSDAQFFLKTDLAKSSYERAKNLESVVFAAGLGSLLDRVNRIKWIAKYLALKLSFDDRKGDFAIQAAALSKNDLVSQMVGEFPELQGLMGAKYILSEGKEFEIAIAIFEQYFPRFSGDCLPQSDTGSVLAISDKLELILSIFSKGERPTGSSDPYALRRAGNGLFQILWFNDWPIDLELLISEAIDYWKEILPTLKITPDILFNEISEFLRQRIISLLEEMNIDSDLVRSVVGSPLTSRRVLKDPIDAKIRANLLSSLRKNGKLLELQAVFNRASKLADKSDLNFNILGPDNIIDETLFESDCEFALLNVLKEIEPLAVDNSHDRYHFLVEKLVLASKCLQEFFDGENSVMVMTDDLSVRTNRLNLLSLLRNQALELADFTRING